MSMQVAETADSQAEEYEVLSIHSSENELGDESYSVHAGGDLSDNEADDANDTGASTTASGEDDAGDNESSAHGSFSSIDSADDGSFRHAQPASSGAYKLPSDFPWSDRAQIMADLDDGLRHATRRSARRAHSDWSETFDVSDYEGDAPAADAQEPVSPSDWVHVIVPEPSKTRVLKYIVLSGEFQDEYLAFFRRLHWRFPSLSLLWVDLGTSEVKWITKERATPSKKELLKHAIRMDLYSHENEHSASRHKLIDLCAVDGFEQLGVVPVCSPDFWRFDTEFLRGVAGTIEGLPCNMNAPVEMDDLGKTMPLTLESDLSDIDAAHLAAVLETTRRGLTREVLALRRESARVARRIQRARWSLLALALALAILLVRRIVANTEFAVGTTCKADDGEKRAWFLEFSGHTSHSVTYGKPLKASKPSQTPAADSRWSQASAYSKHMGDELAEKFAGVPSAVRLPSYSDVEAYFREVAILMHRAALAARQWSSERAAWIQEHSQELWNTYPDIVDKIGRRVGESVHGVCERLAHEWTASLLPLWQLGREHAGRFMH